VRSAHHDTIVLHPGEGHRSTWLGRTEVRRGAKGNSRHDKDDILGNLATGLLHLSGGAPVSYGEYGTEEEGVFIGCKFVRTPGMVFQRQLRKPMIDTHAASAIEHLS